MTLYWLFVLYISCCVLEAHLHFSISNVHESLFVDFSSSILPHSLCTACSSTAGPNFIDIVSLLDLNTFLPIQQNESSITLQWKRVGNSSFTLQFDGVLINIPAPHGNGRVIYTVSNLTAGTLYTFTLFTVFDNITHGRISTVAATGK